MRKKWLFFLILFVLVIAILYIWRYKQSQDFEKRVPAYATKVVNVNLRQIENHLLFDFLANPVTYLKPRKKKDTIEKPKFSLTRGVKIPKNILFYTNADHLENNWFSTVIDVNDKDELSRFLLKENFSKVMENETTFFTRANVVVAVRAEHLILGFKERKENNIRPILISCFENKDFLSEDNAVLKSLKNSKSDVVFLSNNTLLEANFKDGIFELEGELNSDLFVANENSNPDTDGVISFSGKLNKNHKAFNQIVTDKKSKFNEIMHLSLDSIVQKWNGNLNLNISSIEHKTDTIVSYEYDDDFNKVEIKSTQNKKIPKLNLILGQENVSTLSDYFYSKNAIQIVETDTIFTPIPFFKFLTTDTNTSLILRVNTANHKFIESISASKLKFYLNVEKYFESPLDIPIHKEQEMFLKPIKTTTIDWSADNQFLFKINLIDESRNFLGVFIKN